MTDEAVVPADGVFKEVPGFDPRTLVLVRGSELLDLQFCSCPNKYKKRFSTWLEEHQDSYENIKWFAKELVQRGYGNLEIEDLVDYVRLHTMLAMASQDYLKAFPHDFDLDVIYRQFLVRKLMMEEESLFGKLVLKPIKCKANCGYPAGND